MKYRVKKYTESLFVIEEKIAWLFWREIKYMPKWSLTPKPRIFYSLDEAKDYIKECKSTRTEKPVIVHKE